MLVDDVFGKYLMKLIRCAIGGLLNEIIFSFW